MSFAMLMKGREMMNQSAELNEQEERKSQKSSMREGNRLRRTTSNQCSEKGLQ